MLTRVSYVPRGTLQYILNMFHFSRFDTCVTRMTFVLHVYDTYDVCATVVINRSVKSVIYSTVHSDIIDSQTVPNY